MHENSLRKETPATVSLPLVVARRIGKSSEASELPLGFKTRKAQNEKMFSGCLESGHSICRQRGHAL